MKISITQGFVELDLPPRIRAMVPAKFGVEYFKPTPDFGKGQLLCITYGRTPDEYGHIDVMVDEHVLRDSDAQIKAKIIRPMVDQLNRFVQRHRKAA